MTGVRAYERRADLRAYNRRLLDYAERGGTLIVQYNKFEFNQQQFGPYPAMDLFLRIALVRPDNVAALPEELTFYRRHPGQLSSDWRGMKGDWARLLERARALAPDQMLAVEERADANM